MQPIQMQPFPKPVIRTLVSAAATAALLLPSVSVTGQEAGTAETAPAPWFRDAAADADVDRPHTNRSFDNPYAHIMEGYTALGAAVAVADYDGDGREDLFVTDSEVDGRNLLYRNLGGLRFEEVGEAAGVAAGNDADNATANALWLDYDGDGDPDLLVVRFGRSLLYENLGPGPDGAPATFRDVTGRAGLGGYRNAIVAIAFDHDGDGDLDLLLGNYFAPVNLFDPQTSRFFPESFETAANGGGLTLLRNNLGHPELPLYSDVTEAAGLAHHTGWTLDLGHADADLDGDQDLYVAADFGTDRLFRNEGDGTFADVTEEAIGIDTKKGMNADWGDFDNDGLLDVYVTNITDEYMREGNFLWKNNGDGTFTDVARETGTWDTGWGWAGKFFDADNDGWLDLYVVNGWVSAGEGNYVVDIFELILRREADLAEVTNWPPMGDKSLSGYQHNELLLNRGGVLFEDVAAAHGVDSLRDGRGVAVADLDLDGRLDLFVANANGVPHLWHNEAPPRSWIAFELRGAGANPEAVGALVRVTAGGVTRTSFVNGGNGFASQSSRRVHVGLGDAAAVERVEVRWPSGATQRWDALPAGRLYRLTEGEEGAPVLHRGPAAAATAPPSAPPSAPAPAAAGPKPEQPATDAANATTDGA